jgi:hypothetical protein
MMPKNNPKDKNSKDAKVRQGEDAENKLPSDTSSQTDEDILTQENPAEERTVESERPDGDMRK